MNRTKIYTVELTDKEKKALNEVYDNEFKIKNYKDQVVANIIHQIINQEE